MAKALPVTVGIGPVSFADVVAVARDDAQVIISGESLAEVGKTREVIESLADDHEPHYGVSTGFGAMATRYVPADLRSQLQRSLIRSHAAGSGAEVEREVVRAMMLLRISTLATGRTGVRVSTLQTYVDLLNAQITPVVHEYGSLGCSGDLAPLSHCALALMGEGAVRDRSGTLRPAADALAAAGIAPVRLAEKEGLALINGTDGMLGMLVMALTDLRRLLKVADITAAMSVEALLGTDDVFAEDLHLLRPHPGQLASAANLRRLMAEQRDPRVAPHRGLYPGPGRVLAALLAAGRGRRAGHRRPCRPGRADRARLGDRQPGGHPRRPGGVQRELPRRADRLRAGLPGHRRRRPGQHQRAPHRPVPRPGPQRRAQPRSWPRSPASTAAT